MKIGIIGAGAIGRIYATLWHKAGHEVFLSARKPDAHRTFVASLGDRAYIGTPAEAAAFGDVILLAVNYPTVDTAIAEIAPYAVGKMVMDATNPLGQGADGKLERLIPEGMVAADVMSAKLPRSRVTKAFTTLWTGYVETKADAATPTVGMPYAADAPTDAATLSRLIADAGFVPVEIGGLAASAPLDPGSPIWNVVLTPEEIRERVSELAAPPAA